MAKRQILPPVSSGQVSTATIENAVSSVAQARSHKKALNFNIGDTVDVYTTIVEAGEERVQVFTGTVIAHTGSGSRETFTVRRNVAGEGVERKFPLHSGNIVKIDVKQSSIVRRAKLYFLRDLTGKSVRLKPRRQE